MNYTKERFSMGIAKQDGSLHIGLGVSNTIGPHNIQIFLLFFFIYIEYDFRKNMDTYN